MDLYKAALVDVDIGLEVQWKGIAVSEREDSFASSELVWFRAIGSR
jgi:hypothetical protein